MTAMKLLRWLPLLLLAFFLCPNSHPCPVHDGATGYTTGQHAHYGGHEWVEMKCPYDHGHTFWIRCD